MGENVMDTRGSPRTAEEEFSGPDDGTPSSWLIGTDRYQEIEIQGEPAVVVQGGWDSTSGQWAVPRAITIVWTRNGVQYHLVSASSVVSQEDLVRMAKSTR
jgi:hypothetical protein